jgi:hypothetical protein
LNDYGNRNVHIQEFTVEDLYRLYVHVPKEGGAGDDDRENITVPHMTDRQFRQWIVAKGELHGVQILPTFGRLGLETRLAMVNRLVRNGVKIYLAPVDALPM